jgi:SRSO17 transposase
MPDLIAESDARLDLFLDHVTAPLENTTQRAVFAEYAVGLLSDAERKSMEPLAALARPDDPGAAHKAFVYFTGTARWEDLTVRRHAAAWALWGMTAGGPVRGTILDDTGILKQGTHSVGVQRQYTGSAGKITNCQIAVTLGVYTAQHAALIDVDIYLPQDWINSPARRQRARVPENMQFRTKGEIALDMLKSARRDGVPLGDVLRKPPATDVVVRSASRPHGLGRGVPLSRPQRASQLPPSWLRSGPTSRA